MTLSEGYSKIVQKFQVVSRNDILENHAILYATFSDILIWEDHPY